MKGEADASLFLLIYSALPVPDMKGISLSENGRFYRLVCRQNKEFHRFDHVPHS